MTQALSEPLPPLGFFGFGGVFWQLAEPPRNCDLQLTQPKLHNGVAEIPPLHALVHTHTHTRTPFALSTS